MSPEEQKAAWIEGVKRFNFNNAFRGAWHSIATERGYRFDAFLGTASRGTIAIISYLRAKGL